MDQIRRIGKDPVLIKETARQVKETVRNQKNSLLAEQKRLRRDLTKKRDECRQVLDTIVIGKTSGPTISDRLAELEEHARVLESRLAEISTELDSLAQQTFNQADLEAALESFDEIWEVLYPVEQAKIIHFLVERVEYDGGVGTVRLHFQFTGIQSLATEIEATKTVPIG